MNSNEILAALDQIAGDSSKKNKEALVASFGAHESFRRTLVAALNPFKRYGVLALPERGVACAGAEVFTDDTWALLERLEKRDLSGNAARDAVARAMDGLSPASAQLLRRILTKDLRAGFGENTVNKAIPKLIPDFAYMRCALPPAVKLGTWPWAEGVYSQLKADGMFANVDVEDSGVAITTRQGSPVPLGPLGQVVDAICDLLTPGYQYHGEMLVEAIDPATGLWALLPRQKGNGRLNSVLKGGDMPADHRVIFQVWDRVPRAAVVPKGRHTEPYKSRFAALTAMLAAGSAMAHYIAVVPTRVVHSLEEAYVHYREMLALGLEGTVIKHPLAIWRDGDSLEQVKLKLDADCDLEIVGFNPGEGKNAATFGSIACRSKCGRLEVNVSGFKDDERKSIHERREQLLSTVLTTKSNGIMYPSKEGGVHSLFLPRAVEFRGDKSEADTLERIIEQFDAAIAA